ncbi:APC family permease [Streptomyces marispadix]|uniref:APC family permease n=1 Tax=Streptomyces marispadix TaxID=2922868 RepID=A0ABS9T222_9ACTN|nr:APC family permease [Streptomyces marispadix]MCH6162585.1 APC family permease [Streptomyces marispadix]
MSAPPLDHRPPAGVPRQTGETGLRKELGFWSLTGVAFGGMIGSGWLFGAYYAAQGAGPAALFSWPLAGGALILVGMVLVQLGATRPQAGGMVRWPMQAGGPVVGAVISWGVLLAVTSALAAESSAIVQYAERYIPGVYDHGALTAKGTLVAVVLLGALVLLNWFGVALFAKVNLLLTVVKTAVPLLTITALLLSGFHTGNIEAGGGWAPYGWPAMLSVVATAGIIYSMNGFGAAVELSGEARDPRRDLPRAVIMSITLVVVLYMLLQLVFLLAVPEGRLGDGWQGVNLSSPYGQLALALDLGWLATVIYADAVISPAGAVSVFVASGARETYATARNGVLPRSVAVIHGPSGVPRRAMLGNFVISVLFLVPFRGWQDLITVVGVLSLLGYSACAVAAGTFRASDGVVHATWTLPGLRWIAPASFVVSTGLIHWAGWDHLRIALPMAASGVLIFAVRHRLRPGLGRELALGAWLLGYLAALYLVSWAGSFGGSGWLAAPWDSVAAAAMGLAVYYWGVRSGGAYQASQAGSVKRSHEAETDAAGGGAEGTSPKGTSPGGESPEAPGTSPEAAG